MGGITLSEERIGGGLGRGGGKWGERKEQREGEMWFACKMNKNFKKEKIGKVEDQ